MVLGAFLPYGNKTAGGSQTNCQRPLDISQRSILCTLHSDSPSPLLHQKKVRHMDQLDAVVVACGQVVHGNDILVIVVPDIHKIGGLPLGLLGQAVASFRSRYISWAEKPSSYSAEA